MVNIIPAIMPKTKGELMEKLEKVWGSVSRVQLDVVDGVFAKTVTIGPEILGEINTIVRFDAHLMVEKPELWLEKCMNGGVERVIGQVEMMDDVNLFIADGQAMGMEVGLAFDLETNLERLAEVVTDLDCVLLMSVPAGAQGQKFDRRVLKKIMEVRKLSKTIPIVIDGGIDEVNIKQCLVAEWAEELEEDELNRSFSGMEFVVGSHLFAPVDTLKALEQLRHLSPPTPS